MVDVDDKTDHETPMTVARVHAHLTLSTCYDDEDWDISLALQLWKECTKGARSRLQGYCSLLTQGIPLGDGGCPPPAGPNALRHWTDNQKRILTESDQGRKLLAHQVKQEERWKAAYDSLAVPDMTYEQFEWALEVVNSRSFCGTFWSTYATTNG